MKNKHEIQGNKVVIHLNRGLETVIDVSDLEVVDSFPNTWTAIYSPKVDNYYVVGEIKRNGIKKRYRLHRFIMNAPDGMVVDHINHDTLDNRSSTNLRLATNAQNMQNINGLRSDNTSGTRNVHWVKARKKYRVSFRVAGQMQYYGHYETLEEASKVADELRPKLFPYYHE